MSRKRFEGKQKQKIRKNTPGLIDWNAAPIEKNLYNTLSKVFLKNDINAKCF